MKKIFLLSLVSMILMANLVLAGDFRLHYGGSQIFTVTTGGVVNASGTISESGVLLSDTYLALSGGALTGEVTSDSNITTTGDVTAGYFFGDGSHLTGVTVGVNATTISYKNITDIPTCAAEDYLSFDGTTLTCDTIPANSVTIAGENITSGTVAEAYLPSTIYTLGLNASQLATGTIPVARLAANSTIIEYHNITGIPTCTGSDVLTYDGSDLSCTTPAAMSYTNIALTNQSNTFTGNQNITGELNVSGIIRTLDWSNVTIQESQITDLAHTVDTSATVNCSDGQVLLGNGTCWDTSVFFDDTDTVGIEDYTNIAMINESNTFTPDQVFTGYVNATKGVSLANDNSVITRNGVETTNISIDSSGNINFYLG